MKQRIQSKPSLERKFSLVKRNGSLLACAFCLLSLLSACDTTPGRAEAEQPSEAPALPTAPYDYQADENNVLLTYLGEEGRFLIAEKLSEIPSEARAQVRVVKDSMATGTSEVVYAGDLSGAGPRYTLNIVQRSEWEALGKKARSAQLAKLQPKVDSPEAAANVDAILYGASWCGACKAAEAHLEKRGVRLIKKDIEEETGARAEMKGKMKKAGLAGSSIPVIDIGGIVVIGASTSAIDVALRRAQGL